MRAPHINRIAGVLRAIASPWSAPMRRTRAAAAAALGSDPVAPRLKPDTFVRDRRTGRGSHGAETEAPHGTTHEVIVQAEPAQQGYEGPAIKRKRGKAPLDPSNFVQKDIDSLRQKACRIATQLDVLYPDPKVPLDSASPFQLLVAVILSAQVGRGA